MTRRKLLYSVFGLPALAVSYPCYVEPRWLDARSYRVKLGRTGIVSPVRILQLSDLHASFFVPMSMVEHAVTLGLAQKPDLICVTGDFITGRAGFESKEYAAVLRRLSAAAPAFAVMGNHDGGLWARGHLGFEDHKVVDRLLEDSGIELLHNRAVRVEVRGQAIELAGVGDLWSDEINARGAFAAVDARNPVVLLAHNPDSKEVLAGHPWDLMLSGHTHGGQIMVPFEGPIYAPVRDKRYVAGLKSWGSRQIHVTRGVGNVGGVRFRCRPEINLLLLEKRAANG
jgi:predicted MPP superfamily phosphohydrolase